jgi:Peptidase family M41
MVSFLVDTSGVERDHTGRSKNLPKHTHSWVETFERERARLAACEEERRTRWEREDAHNAWMRERQRNSTTADLVIAKPIEQTEARTAIHEAGHAIIGNVLGLTVVRATIEPEGASDGIVQYQPKISDSQLLLCTVAGREAEMVHFGDAGNGDGGDIRNARRIALRMTDGDSVMAEKIIARNRAIARRLLRRERGPLARVAELLVERRTLVWPESDEVIEKALRAPRLKFPGRRKRVRSERSRKSYVRYQRTAAVTAATGAPSGNRVYTAANAPPHMRSLFEDTHYRNDGWVL